jgi:hypothetical protein
MPYEKGSLACRTLYKENTESLIDASKQVGLEINIGKTKYMLQVKIRT